MTAALSAWALALFALTETPWAPIGAPLLTVAMQSVAVPIRRSGTKGTMTCVAACSTRRFFFAHFLLSATIAALTAAMGEYTGNSCNTDVNLPSTSQA